MATAPNPYWQAWEGQALIVGPGGLGLALAAELTRRAPSLRVRTAGRRAADLPLDLGDDVSLERFSAMAAHDLSPLRVVINTAGLLHDGALQPEKRLSQVRRHALERSFAVNAFGPLLLAQAIEPALARDCPVHFASLSARVGSIGDNRLGGWYAYRAAKAAQNQLLRTLAIEWQRRLPQACVTLLHPGTAATPLSAPFRGSLAASALFTPARSASHLLDVLEGQTATSSGAFLAWDGQPVPW
ncbi:MULTISPECIES: SDR family NAD(P)-dependent oxidoreductase [unclassified Cyanobium]|uniref:SDR family NAD(P)-dependent oxidoreductase n=1 Tax=unclassified Cyanobium TaxID=2627006 RepID=UPI0020CBC555|nr:MULTISPECIES: SDR family NAD(P)-dependent oxidoreductase [unclassified Cyanobium]MCP9858234.1 SDR family NAD(P)-dependent oxidoreductase [Cyanobium sp. Cruz-8H5]MCP9865616.1 SDR family NAD(P)-dependent oxidoreductase [Cyanobium sp. Cruz-8D1]